MSLKNLGENVLKELATRILSHKNCKKQPLKEQKLKQRIKKSRQKCQQQEHTSTNSSDQLLSGTVWPCTGGSCTFVAGMKLFRVSSFESLSGFTMTQLSPFNL